LLTLTGTFHRLRTEHDENNCVRLKGHGSSGTRDTPASQESLESTTGGAGVGDIVAR
jgi:hypothetical protein